MAKRKHARRKTAKRRRRSISGNQAFAPAVVSGIRKRKKHSRKRHKRGKMGAITGNPIADMLLGVAAGVIGGHLVEHFVPLNPKIQDGAKMAAGLGAVALSNDKFVQGLGAGLFANGLTTGSHNFGFIHGMREFMSGIGLPAHDEGKDVMTIEMNGVDMNSTKFISGTELDQPTIISGDAQSPMNGSGTEMHMPSVVSGMDY
jgi:hypothetical protein